MVNMYEGALGGICDKSLWVMMWVQMCSVIVSPCI